jgi:hypothetical protein
MQEKLVLGGNHPILFMWFTRLGQLKIFGTNVHVKKMKKISQFCCSTLKNDKKIIQQNK